MESVFRGQDHCKQKTQPNLPHLAHALNQAGPWKDQNTVVSAQWLADALATKIKMINWLLAAQDVAPFLPASEQVSLSLWSERFFADKVSKLMQTISARELGSDSN
jgi:primosomal protein N''